MIFLKPQLLKFGEEPITDHNRSELGVDVEEIGNTKRMVNGTLRKYIVARKHSFDVSWEDVPHSDEHTIDGFAGGRWLYEFYLDDPGVFPLTIVEGDGEIRLYFVTFEEFSHSIKKRGLYDFWDVNLRLVEV